MYGRIGYKSGRAGLHIGYKCYIWTYLYKYKLNRTIQYAPLLSHKECKYLFALNKRVYIVKIMVTTVLIYSIATVLQIRLSFHYLILNHRYPCQSNYYMFSLNTLCNKCLSRKFSINILQLL